MKLGIYFIHLTFADPVEMKIGKLRDHSKLLKAVKKHHVQLAPNWAWTLQRPS